MCPPFLSRAAARDDGEVAVRNHRGALGLQQAQANLHAQGAGLGGLMPSFITNTAGSGLGSTTYSANTLRTS